jgi:hypothetical protein
VADAPPQQQAKTGDAVSDVVDKQELNGSWTDAKSLGISVEIWPELSSQSESGSIFATVFALALLRVKAGARKAAWALVEEKALTWLSSRGVTNAEALILRAVSQLRA